MIDSQRVTRESMAVRPGVSSLLRVLNDRSTLELLLTDGVITRGGSDAAPACAADD